MATRKLLVPGMGFGTISFVLLVIAIAMDTWYVFDADLYLKICPDAEMFEQSLISPLPISRKSAIPNNAFDFRSMRATDQSEKSCKKNKTSVGKPAPLRESLTDEKLNLRSGFMKHANSYAFRNGKRDTKIPQLKRFRHSSRKTYTFMNKKHSYGTQTSLNLKSPLGLISDGRQKKWKKLIDSLTMNLHSFGGRDISARGNQFSVRNTPILSNKSKVVKKLSECRLRQFSTVTGLLRVCYVSTPELFITKLIENGLLSKCQAVSYSRVEIKQLPDDLRYNETSVVYKDEKTSLDIRRTTASFLFLGITLQAFGMMMITFGWCRNAGFEQLSGGIILLMSGVFQLSGLLAFVVLCQGEMSRQPYDLYDVPTLVLHDYGCSAFIAWASFGGTLLASFLCVMGPLHQPALPLSTCTQSLNEIRKRKEVLTSPKVTNCRSNDQTLKTPSHLSWQSKSQSIDLQAIMSNTASTERDFSPKLTDERVDNVNNSSLGEQSLQTFFNVKAEYVRSVMSPVASVRTPKAAIRALEEEKLENLELMRKKLRSQSVAEFKFTTLSRNQNLKRQNSECAGTGRSTIYITNRGVVYGSGHHKRIPSSHSMLEKYARKTKSLPRDLTRTQTSSSICQHTNPSLLVENCNPSVTYRSTVAPNDFALKKFEKVGEITPSAKTSSEILMNSDLRCNSLKISNCSGRYTRNLNFKPIKSNDKLQASSNGKYCLNTYDNHKTP